MSQRVSNSGHSMSLTFSIAAIYRDKNWQSFPLFPHWLRWQLLFEKVSWHCADAYIITTATDVDTLDIDYKQTDPISSLAKWQANSQPQK